MVVSLLSDNKSKLETMSIAPRHFVSNRVSSSRIVFQLFYCICFVFLATSCVPSSDSALENTLGNWRVEPTRTQAQLPELPVLYDALDLPYTIRQSEQPTGLPDLIMLNNSVPINSVTTFPLELAIDVNGLLVDAGIFGGKFLLRLSLYLNVDNPSNSFAMHQYDSLVLLVDGQTIPLSRDTNDIGISKHSDGGYVEFGFFTAFPNLYLILARAKQVRLELIGGKDGVDRLLVATLNNENQQRFAEFHKMFDEIY